MSGDACRLRVGGIIERDKPIAFAFNGRRYRGCAGDTLASALLANNVRLVARSFKYHRPRGVYSAGVEEPNAWVQIGRRAYTDTNVPATALEIYEGLTAQSQNCWPSVRFDLMAMVRLWSPLWAAGFYYKTFMGPGRGTGAWMFFEKFIRRAAGMGVASKQPDPDCYDKRHAHCDVLVVGAGPAGLQAALTAVENGARVMLVEQDSVPGGSWLSESHADGRLAGLVAELEASGVCILTRTTAFGVYDGGVVGLVERVTDHLAHADTRAPRQRYWVVRAAKTVVATGAIERPIVFGGNDLPGVMLASAARTYVNRYAVLPGRQIVVFTNNDSAYQAAQDLARAGASLSVVDFRPRVSAELQQAMTELNADIFLGHGVLRANGGKALRAVDIGPVDASGRLAGVNKSLQCDCLCVSGGWSPVVHLWSQTGGKVAYDHETCAFKPSGALDSIQCVGAAAGEAVKSFDQSPLAGHITPVWRVVGADGKCAGTAFVDLHNDVTVSDIELAHREGYRSVEHLKRYTTQGMAPDQGKTANVNAIGLLAEARHEKLSAVGTTTFRPPYTPVACGVLAGHDHGRHFRPTRRSPMHPWHETQGAVFQASGLWMRPWYYPLAGEDHHSAARREAEHVRAHLGIVDVSTLGKIAVQGPDATEFLDRVYANDVRSLAQGGIRYGVMLREDGFVFEDGMIARLGEDDYFLTTSTVHAESALARMEFMLQVLWPDLRVHITSVSDQWAAIAVAGPKSRALLQRVCRPAELSNEALRIMRFVDLEIDGMSVRLCRISFSGELAYEIYVPASCGQQVWLRLMEAGVGLDLIPYGTEAMATLRIEKGYVAGPEFDGRMTLHDLGLEALCAPKRHFIGAALRHRPALEDPHRPTLVGLRSIDPGAPIVAGSILFAGDADRAGHGEGHVTSATYSPAMQAHIALGFLADGRDRHGEQIVAANPIENGACDVRVVSPCFFDPDGSRQDG